MYEDSILTPVVIVVGLMFVAAVTALVVRRLRFPYTIGLLIVGIALGLAAAHIEAAAPLRQVQLTPDLILYLILPTLLFEAAINIDARILLERLVPILVLAVPGLLVSTFIVGYSLHAVIPLSLGAALLFGALISATDPVAVIALFKELGVNERLSTLMDGESLFNDATAIVMFNIVLASLLIAGGEAAGAMSNPVVAFLVVFFGGLVVGLAVGIAVCWVISLAHGDRMVQVALSTVMAYVAFIVADHLLDVSGVMAVVGAGMYASWAAARTFDDSLRRYIREFWKYAAFVANSLIFLLIGLTEFHLVEDLGGYSATIGYIVAGFVIVTLARVVVVFGFSWICNLFRKDDPISSPEQKVMWWGGLRGAVPLALAMGLPPDFESRTLLVQLTLGVVLLSLLVQGTTTGKLLRSLKLTRS